MANIAWGKPKLFVKDIDDTQNGAWYELPTPVEDSTELGSEKGDKLEAKIEGGENEDVKYKRSTYSLAFNIRKAKKRQAPFPSLDGVVNHHYAVLLQPEDPAVEGFYIEKTTVSIDETFTAADGAMWQCQLEALKAASGDTVKWGIVTLATTGSGANLSQTISFTEASSNDDIIDGEELSPQSVTASAIDQSKNKGGKPADAS